MPPPAPPSARTPALRAATGLILLAAGAILVLAVHVRLSFLSLHVTGLILAITGLTWLWVPVQGKREILARKAGVVLRYLQWDAEPPAEATLADLLTDGQPSAGP
jgi:hypothetical protein